MPPGRGPEIAVLFAGSLFSDPDVFSDAASELRNIFGTAFLESPALPWTHTDYYAKELDPPVFRKFLFFDKPVDASSVVDAKLSTMTLEEGLSRNGKRQINIDPGYMTLAKVVLASRKNYSHRIYLGRSVFGEVELFFKDGIFNPLPYTYPDYRDDTFLSFFLEARRMLKKKLIPGI